MKLLTVIARYQEDLLWVENLDTDVVIYNKGETYLFDFPRIDSENIGREAETFLRAIVEFYDKLHEYDGVVFLQGNPFDHCDDVVEKINNIKNCNDIVYLCKTTVRAFIKAMNKIHNKSDYIIKYMFGEPAESFIIGGSLGGFKSTLLCECLGIDLNGYIEYEWGNGAQYIVPSKFILTKSLKWWQDTLKTFMLYMDVLSTNDEAAYIFEYTWPLIYDPKYKVRFPK